MKRLTQCFRMLTLLFSASCLSAEETLVFPADPAAHPVQAMEGTISLEGFDDGPAFEIKEFRRKLIARVLKVLKSPTADRSMRGPVYESMLVLGEWRADSEDVIDELAMRLPYEMDADGGDVGLMYSFPAAYALIRIGASSRPQMIRQITRDESTPLRRRLAAWVLVEIELYSDQHRYLDPDAEDEDDPVAFGKSEVNAYLDRLISRTSLFNAAERQRLTEAKGYVSEYRYARAATPEDVIPNYEPEDPWAE